MTRYSVPLLVAALSVTSATPAVPVAAAGPRAAHPVGVSASPSAPSASALAPAAFLDTDLAPVRRAGTRAFEPRPAPFEVTVDGRGVPHEVLAVTVLPGAVVEVEAAADAVLRYASGTAEPDAPGAWRWTAPPSPGVVALSVERPEGETVRLNVLVAHPAGAVRDGTLNGFRIGAYRATPLRGDPAYLPPTGFIEVGAGDEDILVSPHFTLGEFLCKQPGLPRFLALSTSLVLKLEAVLEAANEGGIDAPGFTVMSGFRTPWYNRSIGNTTDYSRHLWGDAADIYVDADGNGDMDDLNGDGRIDLGDARTLAAVVDRVERSGLPEVEVGGVGLYRRTGAHGPFVHVDARGTAARW